jgi:hypothetical protein
MIKKTLLSPLRVWQDGENLKAQAHGIVVFRFSIISATLLDINSETNFGDSRYHWASLVSQVCGVVHIESWNCKLFWYPGQEYETLYNVLPRRSQVKDLRNL